MTAKITNAKQVQSKSRSRHDELTRQIDDLATMLGDLLSKEE